jgi:hypothetical protein
MTQASPSMKLSAILLSLASSEKRGRLLATFGCVLPLYAGVLLLYVLLTVLCRNPVPGGTHILIAAVMALAAVAGFGRAFHAFGTSTLAMCILVLLALGAAYQHLGGTLTVAVLGTVLPFSLSAAKARIVARTFRATDHPANAIGRRETIVVLLLILELGVAGLVLWWT